MTNADFQAVASLAEELGYPSDEGSIRQRFELCRSDSDLLLVAAAGDRALGFIQAHRLCIIEAGFRVEIVGLVVSSVARRSGIGRRLIEEVERWAASLGAEVVMVRSNTARTTAHDFYPAMGYEKIKTQAVYQKQLREIGDH